MTREGRESLSVFLSCISRHRHRHRHRTVTKRNASVCLYRNLDSGVVTKIRSVTRFGMQTLVHDKSAETNITAKQIET